jgi:hypothetical protein
MSQNVGHSCRGDAPITADFDGEDSTLPDRTADRFDMPRNDFGECAGCN